MKKRLFCAFCAAALLCTLTACVPQEGAAAPTPTPETAATPEPTPIPTPEPTPAPTPSEDFPFPVLPVTEEAIRAHFAALGQPLGAVTPSEGDYLVEVRANADTTDYRLYWIFGSTGRTVPLSGYVWGIERYELTGHGSLTYCTTGDTDTPLMSFPHVGALHVCGDENGMIQDSMDTVSQFYNTAYIGLEDLAEPATFYFAGHVRRTEYEAYYSEYTDEELFRYFQVEDARIGVSGLSFSFVPSGANMARFNSCMAGSGHLVPTLQMRFDPSTRLLTLRYYNTCLSVKNGITQKDLREALGDWVASYYRYPYKFPEGSLGRDSAFLRNVEVHPDGEDTVLTCTVDESVLSFTIESDRLCTQRIVFSTEEPNCPVPAVCR